MKARILAALLLLFFTTSICAQENPQKRGLYVSYHTNHKKEWVGKYKKYQKHGKWKLYDDEGHLLKSESYSRGKRNGTFTEYFTNGKTAFVGSYLNDLPEGEWKRWYDNGKQASFQNYKNGLGVGTWQKWYESGTLQITEYYLAGKKEGEQHTFWENGNRQSDISMSGSRQNGTTTNYNREGKLVSKTEFVNDVQHGIMREWAGETVVREAEYRNGLLNGYLHRWTAKGDTLEWAGYVNDIREGQTIRWKNNKRVSEEFYVNNKQQGQCNYFDRQTGKLLYIRWMNAGKPDSLQTFYPNGQRMNRECFNEAGLRNGRYFEWSETGSVLVTGYYFNGQKQFVWKVFYPNSNLKSIATYQLGSLSGAYSRYYASGKKMFLQQFAVGEAETKIEGKPQIWDENGKPLKPGTPQYEAIKASVYVEETFVKPVDTKRRIAVDDGGESTLVGPAAVEKIGTDVNSESKDTDASPERIGKNDFTGEKQDAVLSIAEKMPHYPGGETAMQQYMEKNIRQPEACSECKGTVYLRFVVERDGSLTDVQAMKDVRGAPALTTEAIRLIKSMPNWEPAKMNGRTVRCAMTIPVKFK